MASRPSPAKRQRIDEGAAQRPRDQLNSILRPPPVANGTPTQPSPSTQPQTIVPPTPPSPQQQQQPLFKEIPNKRQRSSLRTVRATPPEPSDVQPRPQPQTPAIRGVPPGWGPMRVPEAMTMTLHEALEIIDPTSQTPHDLYVILVYAAAAHTDVAEMLDKFARSARQRAADCQMELQAQGQGFFVPIEDSADDTNVSPAAGHARTAAKPKSNAAATNTKGRRGNYRPKSSITPDDEDPEKVERRRQRELKAARARERRAQKLASTAVKPGEDKDLNYLVRKAEEELGWTGKWLMEETGKPKYSRMAIRKDVSYWYNQTIGVRDNLKWMQRQLLREMGMDSATFGTRRNALTAMREILHAVVVDTSEIGVNLREHWFESLQENFRKAMAMLSYGELARLRESDGGKWVRDHQRFLKLIQTKELPDKIMKEILLMVDKDASDDFDVPNSDNSDKEGEEEGEEEEEEEDDTDSDDRSSGSSSSESSSEGN